MCRPPLRTPRHCVRVTGSKRADKQTKTTARQPVPESRCVFTTPTRGLVKASARAAKTFMHSGATPGEQAGSAASVGSVNEAQTKLYGNSLRNSSSSRAYANIFSASDVLQAAERAGDEDYALAVSGAD